MTEIEALTEALKEFTEALKTCTETVATQTATTHDLLDRAAEIKAHAEAVIATATAPEQRPANAV